MGDDVGLKVPETDAEFNRRLDFYCEFMARFIKVHDPVPNGGMLIELKRRERWPLIMGEDIAAVTEPPSREKILRGGR